MVVDLPLFIISQSVHIGVQQDYDEGLEQVGQEPHVNHLHVGGLWKVVTYVDKHRCQYQHGGQIHSDNSLKKHKCKKDEYVDTNGPRRKTP